VQKRDAVGFLGLSPHQKITSTLRMLCYGMCADATDEYCRTSESTTMESLKRFCLAIRAEFEDYHCISPCVPISRSNFASMRNVDSRVCLLL
jgi:hypothetical protein